ncbi:MAG: hypothetical protein GF329_04590 [Candidatus Lokiarchaeota archaeon]|nr:hypothetical protein [Candidatus Lokiarchaeota archaeon]
MINMTQKRIHLVWLQQTLITMLWGKEMYGVEIIRILKLWGEDLGPGKLYPALKNLEEMGALTSRKDNSFGTIRKYYSVTEEGKNILLQNLVAFFAVGELLLLDKYGYLLDEIPKYLTLKPGISIVDFSIPVLGCQI